MRHYRATLRLRVAVGFALLGLGASLALGGGLYIVSWNLEQRLIDEDLRAEFEDYLGRLSRNPAAPPPHSAIIKGYINRQGQASSAVPDVLRGLSTEYHTVHIDGVAYRAAVRTEAARTIYMLRSLAQPERQEQELALFLILGATLTSLLSAAGGWWLAGRIITPVRQLALQVRKRDPMDLHTPLADGLPDDELGALARTFEGYLSRLRAFVERERAFITDVSHELRTPLSVIHGAFEVLTADSNLDATTRDRLDRIARAARAMTDFTAALLMLARERPGAVKDPPLCRVEEVLREVIELHRPQVRHKPVRVELTVSARPLLAVERPLLAVALGNLVRNACAYTEAGWVHLTLDATEVTVGDSGPGIPPEHVARLFSEIPGERPAARGAGIGLPLVKRIADRQGWEISAESKAAHGAVFRLQFTPVGFEQGKH